MLSFSRHCPSVQINHISTRRSSNNQSIFFLVLKSDSLGVSVGFVSLLKDSYSEYEKSQGADKQNRAEVEYYGYQLNSTEGTFILSFQVSLTTFKDQTLSHYKYINLIKS